MSCIGYGFDVSIDVREYLIKIVSLVGAGGAVWLLYWTILVGLGGIGNINSWLL